MKTQRYCCAFCGREVPAGYEPEEFPCCGMRGHVMPVDEYELAWIQNTLPQERDHAEI